MSQFSEIERLLRRLNHKVDAIATKVGVGTEGDGGSGGDLPGYTNRMQLIDAGRVKLQAVEERRAELEARARPKNVNVPVAYYVIPARETFKDQLTLDDQNQIEMNSGANALQRNGRSVRMVKDARGQWTEGDTWQGEQETWAVFAPDIANVEKEVLARLEHQIANSQDDRGVAFKGATESPSGKRGKKG